jgi:hypothetical protein
MSRKNNFYVVASIVSILSVVIKLLLFQRNIASFIFVIFLNFILLLMCCCLYCNGKNEKENYSSTNLDQGRIVNSTGNSNPGRPQGPAPEPILESVVVKEEISEDKDHPPAYDEVILNPLQLEGSEAYLHGISHAPPSNETDARNELKDIDIINDLPKTNWSTWSANKIQRPKFPTRKPEKRPESSSMFSAVNNVGIYGRAEPENNPTQRFIVPVHPYYLIPPSTSMYQTGSPFHIPRVRQS